MRAGSGARRRSRPLFLIGYGVLRFTAEFFREPDSYLGLLSLGMSMGQWLCMPMVAGRHAALALGGAPSGAAGAGR